MTRNPQLCRRSWHVSIATKLLAYAAACILLALAYAPCACADSGDHLLSAIAGESECVASASDSPATISGTAHIQNKGDTSGKTTSASNGLPVFTLGTTGQSLRLEALRLTVTSTIAGSIQYRTHIQNIGWESSWSSNGKRSGTRGKSLRLEAVQIRLTGQLAETYDIYYRAHVQNIGWMAWAKNGEKCGSEGYSYRVEAIQICLVKKGANGKSTAPSSNDQASKLAFSTTTGNAWLNYSAHVQNIGWQSYVSNGRIAGTTGRSLRVEAFKVNLGASALAAYPGSGVVYSAHVQNVGDQAQRANNAIAGTIGKSQRVEAIKVRLTGAIAQDYDVYYRVHVSNIGWLDWTKNGAYAGTSGISARIEAIEMKLVRKNTDGTSTAPGPTDVPYLDSSQTTVNVLGQVSGGSWAAEGTTTQSEILTGLQASIENAAGISGGISYRAHFSNIGWSSVAKNGAELTGSGNKIECVRFKLTGDLATYYDVYYRVYIYKYGWTGWAKDGASCGSTGCGRGIERCQVKVVPKGGIAPGSTENTYSNAYGFLNQTAKNLRAKLNITTDYRSSFVHGVKTKAYQRYIMIHDTEGGGVAENVINGWDSSGAGVAAHFIINKDGSIVQCVALDKIAHHAGYGDTGHNSLYGISEDGRDDMVGTVSIGSQASDYAMNAWSIGIELIHQGDESYPEAQLKALDGLIAYIDAYYGFKSTIIDHKMWRTGNSDTSEVFAEYLANYRDHRTHN